MFGNKQRGPSWAMCGAMSCVWTLGFAQSTSQRMTEVPEEVVVSGSRIKRDSFETATPTISVTAEDIAQRGAIDVLTILNEQPALRGSFGLEFIGGQADIGIQRANLRGFGTQRSLVVVNNRRRVSTATEADARGFVASSFDISNIPTALIERVDVVTGGASSVYGSDAISGAINIVLKDDFEGVDLGGTVGTGFRGLRDYSQAHLTVGKNYDGGNAVFHIEHSESDRLSRNALGGGYSKRVRNDSIAGRQPRYDSSRGADAFIPFYNDVVDFSLPGDTDRNVYIPHLRAGGGGGYTGFFLPIDAQGNVIVDPALGRVPRRGDPGYETALQQRQRWGLAIYDPALGRLRAANLGAAGAISSYECLASSGCEIESYNYDLLVPQRRTNLYGSLTHEISSKVEFVGEVMYSRSFSSRNQNPSDPGFWYPTGYEPWSELFVDALDADGNVVGEVKSPFFPQALIDQIYQIDPSYNPADPSFVDDRVYVGIRQLNEHGPRLNTYERDYLTFSTGLRGDLDSTWSWEAFFDWGKSGLVWTRYNDHEDRRLLAATDIIFNTETDQYECRDRTWRAEGCVPADLINGISPEAVRFLTFNDVNVHDVTQQLATLSFSGDSSKLFALPAGPIKLALGAEWRRTNMRQDPGNGFVRGTTYGGEQRPRFDITTAVKEGYLEAVVPVLRDLPFANLVELEGGLRYTSQSTGDSDVTWKAGGRWSPVEDVRFRGMLARAARSPSGSELLQPTTRTYTTMVDPCDSSMFDPSLGSNETRISNCMALLGLSRGEVLNFTGRPSNIASQAGNPKLSSEVADTLTLGVVLSPRLLPNVSMSIDYYDIEISDLISSVGVDSILEGCVLDTSGASNQFCRLVDRNASTRQIELVTNAGVNINGQQVRGIDVQLNGDFLVSDVVNLFRGDREQNLGSLTVRVIGGWQLENEFRYADPVTGDVFVDDLRGEYLFPEFTLQNQLGYAYGSFATYLNSFWVRASTDDAGLHIPGVIYHDLSASYDLPWSNAQLTFAVRNVLNESGRLSPFTCCSPEGAYDRGKDSRTYAIGFRMSVGSN